MAFIPLGRVGNPLKQGSFLDARSIRGGTITGREIIIAGGTRGVIRSENLDKANNLGWGIWGDGSAFFGASVTFGGDIVSGNWNGANPADLSSVDAGASAGYYFDTSEGAGQLSGPLWMGGSLNLLDGGTINVLNAAHATVGTLQFNSVSGFATFDSPWVFEDNVILDTAGKYLQAQGYAATTPVSGSGDFGNSFVQVGAITNETEVSGGVSWHTATADGVTDDYQTEVRMYREEEAGEFTPPLKIEARVLSVPSSDTLWAQFRNGIGVQDGTVSFPSYHFISDPDTGVYLYDTARIGFSIAGTINSIIDADGFQTVDGTASLPSYAFNNDSDTGMYRPTTNQLNLAAGGWELMGIGGGSAAWTGWMKVPSGTASLPGVMFGADTNTGMYRIGADNIGWAVNGLRAADLHKIAARSEAGFRVSYSSTSDADPLMVSAGVASNPAFTFGGDQDTGMYRSAANQVAFAAGGTLRMLFGGADFIYYYSNGSTKGFWFDESDDSFHIPYELDDIGNHETLRVNRTAGNGAGEIGYYSSWSHLKKYIKPLAQDRGKYWDRSWFMDLEPVGYERRRSERGVKNALARTENYEAPVEIGFTIDNLIENTNLLTTKGNRVGDSPDEYAILAVTVDYVQHLEERVAALEAKLAA